MARDGGTTAARDGGGTEDAGTARDAGVGDAAPTLDERLVELLNAQTIPVTAIDPPPAVSTALYDLGQALFFDPVLSGNFDVACASCHHPSFATGDGLSLTVGTGATGLGPVRAEGNHPAFVPRHSPAIFNRGNPEWRKLFWDGRVEEQPDGTLVGPVALPDGLSGVLAAQAMIPVLSRIEMRGYPGDMTLDGTPNELAAIADDDPDAVWAAIMTRVLMIVEYEAMFLAAFPELGTDTPTFVHAANAIAAFQAVAFAATDTPWDEYLRGNIDAIDDSQKLGAIIFYGAADCGRCHAGPLFSDQKFHNTAIPQIGPGDETNAPFDLGRENVTSNASDHFAFKTPPLRNVLETAPYMHNGVLLDLNAVLRHYADPEGTVERIDPSTLHPDLQGTLQTDPTHVADLHATESPDLNMAEDGRTFIGLSNLRRFLTALTDPGFATLDRVIPATVPSGRSLP